MSLGGQSRDKRASLRCRLGKIPRLQHDDGIDVGGDRPSRPLRRYVSRLAADPDGEVAPS